MVLAKAQVNWNLIQSGNIICASVLSPERHLIWFYRPRPLSVWRDWNPVKDSVSLRMWQGFTFLLGRPWRGDSYSFLLRKQAESPIYWSPSERFEDSVVRFSYGEALFSLLILSTCGILDMPLKSVWVLWNTIENLYHRLLFWGFVLIEQHKQMLK